MVQTQREGQRKTRTLGGKWFDDYSAVQAYFNRRYVAARRQSPSIGTRDITAARFLLEQDCNTREQAISTIDAIFRERIRGGSFFECLVGHYAFAVDRMGHGPRAASKTELRRYAALFAESKAVPA